MCVGSVLNPDTAATLIGCHPLVRAGKVLGGVPAGSRTFTDQKTSFKSRPAKSRGSNYCAGTTGICGPSFTNGMAAAFFMNSRIMRKSTFFVLFVAVITLIALAAVWFWAFAPVLIPLNSINSTELTSADVVRRVWHFRLVQPEWVSNPTDYVLWSRAESLVRFLLVVLGWLLGVAFVVRDHWISRRSTSADTASHPIAAH